MSLQSRLASLISNIGADIKALQISVSNAYSPANPPPVPSGPVSFVALTADKTTLSTTVAPDSTLTLPVAANSIYAVDIYIRYGASNRDRTISWKLGAPSGTTGFAQYIGLTSSGAVASNDDNNLLTSKTLGFSAAPQPFTAKGFVAIGSTAGDLTFDWAASAAGGSTGALLGKGTWLRLTKL